MRLLFCIICPPFAVLLCGRPISAFFNMFLCLFGYVPGVMHAYAIHNDSHTSKQTKRIVKAIKGQNKKPKKKRPCPVHNDARMARLYGNQDMVSESYDDDLIGESGTKFKRRI
jgi:uncharacterized membrane protein YqaE (UPF0057 family)